MSTATHAAPAFDIDGFLRDPDSWNEETARMIASEDGLGELTDDHFSLLKQLRDAYMKMGAVPALSHVCHVSGFDSQCMNKLFPNARAAWRVAGLPNPGDEAVSYL